MLIASPQLARGYVGPEQEQYAASQRIVFPRRVTSMNPATTICRKVPFSLRKYTHHMEVRVVKFKDGDNVGLDDINEGERVTSGDILGTSEDAGTVAGAGEGAGVGGGVGTGVG